VLTLGDGQLAVPASNCTLYGYVLEYYSALSDHDVQLLTINFLVNNQANRLKPTRTLNKHTILNFIYKLSYVSWDGFSNNTDVNIMFNSVLNTYWAIFYSTFPLLRIILYPTDLYFRLRAQLTKFLRDGPLNLARV